MNMKGITEGVVRETIVTRIELTKIVIIIIIIAIIMVTRIIFIITTIIFVPIIIITIIVIATIDLTIIIIIIVDRITKTERTEESITFELRITMGEGDTIRDAAVSTDSTIEPITTMMGETPGTRPKGVEAVKTTEVGMVTMSTIILEKDQK